eukprot:SAG31_NODE_3048_length_4746_cov_965.740908_3_plen_87_part_00
MGLCTISQFFSSCDRLRSYLIILLLLQLTLLSRLPPRFSDKSEHLPASTVALFLPLRLARQNIDPAHEQCTGTEHMCASELCELYS